MIGAVGTLATELGREVVRRHARGRLFRRLDAAEDQARVALVVALDPRGEPRCQLALEAQDGVVRALVVEREAPRAREVHQVVRRDELLVARALRVPAGREPQVRLGTERKRGLEARLQLDVRR